MDIPFKRLDENGLTRCINEECKRIACRRKTAKGAAALLCAEEDPADCLFFVLHEMVSDERHIFRGRRGSRHNRHAFAREPDLMVKRHLRSGENINGQE